MNRTGGDWDPADRHVYFCAGNTSNARLAFDSGSRHILVAVNDLKSDAAIAECEALIDRGAHVLVDSGVFWLTNEHKRAHNMTMDAALALAPEEIDGFDWLWGQYIRIVKRLGDKAWGYIELDQGGMVNKRKTRSKLHDLGLNPIPVYHPLNDGWDYFDELAEGYGRLCWGNVVQANAVTRKHFLQTCWERHRAYPDLWVHLLGLTPNQWLLSYPCDSADSSSWLTHVRWAKAHREDSMLRKFSGLDVNYRFIHSATLAAMAGMDEEDVDETVDEDEAKAGTPDAYRSMAMSVIGSVAMNRCWRHWQNRVQEELGLPLYPPPSEELRRAVA